MKKYLFALILIAFTFSSFELDAQIVITELMYNPVSAPGDPQGGVEYMELFNNGGSSVNLQGYTFDGIDFTFGNVSLAAGATLLLSNDSVGFQARYGMVARQYGGFIQNMGETILLKDNLGQTEDSVTYGPLDPWPIVADGLGPSMNLCSPFADNADGSNWQRSNVYTGFNIAGIEIYGSPGATESCANGPVISFVMAEVEFDEYAGTVEVNFSIDNENPMSTSFFITATSLTASLPADALVGNQNFTIFGNTNDPNPLTFDIVDDTMQEQPEQFLLVIGAPITNNAIVATDSIIITILDNDGPVDKSLILTGVWAGGNGSAGLELFVRDTIDDLSNFGFGSATNGGGTDGVEYTFPAVSWPINSRIYIVNDSADFHDFFGFAPDFEYPGGFSPGFTGDDAIEIFESGQVIDLYGFIDVDGSGEFWEYTGGWAYRHDTTGPDCDVFDSTSWTYGGANVYNNVNTNMDAVPPMPIGTYQYMILPPTPADAASNVVAADVANNGDGDDLEVSFDKAADEGTVSEYRIIIVKSADAATFDLTAANAVTEYFTVNPTGSDVTQIVGAGFNDKDGDLITDAVAYKAFILSIADGINANVNSLSTESNEVTLDNMVAIESLEFTNGLSIYAHQNSLYIRTATTQLFDVNIFNAIGQEVASSKALSGDQVIVLDNLEQGVYMVQYRIGNSDFFKKVYMSGK